MSERRSRNKETQKFELECDVIGVNKPTLPWMSSWYSAGLSIQGRTVLLEVQNGTLETWCNLVFNFESVDLERGKGSECVADFDAHNLGAECWSEWCTRAMHAWKTVLPSSREHRERRMDESCWRASRLTGGMAPMASMASMVARSDAAEWCRN